MKKIDVLILDDSLFIREAMQQELERDINIRVVGKAANAYDARDLIVEHVPDVLIADVNLGRMSGTEFVRLLLPQHYLPVIMISSDASQRAAALASSAVDFITKPVIGDGKAVSTFYREIASAIKTVINGDKQLFSMDTLTNTCLAIGASTGGAEVIVNIIKGMPSMMPPIVVAQHMPANFTKSFADRLNQQCMLSVKEAEDGDVLIPGQVYIAPGGFNAVVKKQKNRWYMGISPAGNTKKASPNIDVLFHSVAEAYGSHALGVLLTGMGKDGAQGLLDMRHAGAVTLAQNKASSVVYGMPRVAKELGAVDYQYAPNEIRQKCIELFRRYSEAGFFLERRPTLKNSEAAEEEK